MVDKQSAMAARQSAVSCSTVTKKGTSVGDWRTSLRQFDQKTMADFSPPLALFVYSRVLRR